MRKLTCKEWAGILTASAVVTFWVMCFLMWITDGLAEKVTLIITGS